MARRGGGGFFGGPGARVFRTEKAWEQLVLPGLHALAFFLGAALMLGVFQLYCFMVGPISWFMVGLWAVLAATGDLVLRWFYDREDLRWMGAVAGGIGLVVGWVLIGYPWLIAIWPELPRWFRIDKAKTWVKIVALPLLVAFEAGFLPAIFRQYIEAFDPGWSARHEANAQGTGIAPLTPFRIWRSLSRDQDAWDALRAENEELRADLQEAQRRGGVTIVLGGETETSPPIPPEGREVLGQYFVKVLEQVDNLSQSAAERHGLTRRYGGTLMEWFLSNPRGRVKYATGTRRGELTPTDLGREMMRELGAVGRPDRQNNHSPTPN